MTRRCERLLPAGLIGADAAKSLYGVDADFTGRKLRGSFGGTATASGTTPTEAHSRIRAVSPVQPGDVVRVTIDDGLAHDWFALDATKLLVLEPLP